MTTIRIAGGRFRGRTLQTPEGQDTRPTSSRAREALFNILEHAPWSEGTLDAQVLDVFAGSGALGLEALSRGARGCLFFETAPLACAVIEANIASLGLAAVARMNRRSALEPGLAPAGSQADLVLLDPPYGKGLGEQAILALLAGGWIASDALIVLEKASGEALPVVAGCELLDSRSYGAACLHFLKTE